MPLPVDANTTLLLDRATAAVTGAGILAPKARPDRTYAASVAGTGAVSATVRIQGSNDDSTYLTLATITLSGTTSAADGFASKAAWPYVRAVLDAVSGTNAAVTVTMGV